MWLAVDRSGNGHAIYSELYEIGQVQEINIIQATDKNIVSAVVW